MINELNKIMDKARKAFESYQYVSGAEKKLFLYAIAEGLEQEGDSLLNTCSIETNLPTARFAGERARTCAQLRAFGDLVGEGSWVEAVIDTTQNDRKPIPKPDMRKMLTSLGPVVVFGASNFPLAYSTAGGDTASALAAGCPVIVKGHPSHPLTSAIVSDIIIKAGLDTGMPPHVFQHVESSSYEIGKILVQHPTTAGVAFTGSLIGGRAIYDYAAQREVPIPVFTEMGSTNPVVFLKEILKSKAAELARMFAASITIGVGQFCTNPGILIGLKSSAFNHFTSLLALELSQISHYKMLHMGIYQNYMHSLEKVLFEKGVETIYHAHEQEELKASPVLVRVSAENFLQNPNLKHEVFGPFSIIVVCDNENQILQVREAVTGQLTTTIMGTDHDLESHQELIKSARNIAGRIVFNNIPTGVEVGHATVHGGPYPATTDSRFTSVGMDAIKRWVRPVCWQDCPDIYLPDELKNGNPLGILRKIDGDFHRNPLLDV
jgi:2,5-dioxopentanoate dehydrogenase